MQIPLNLSPCGQGLGINHNKNYFTCKLLPMATKQIQKFSPYVCLCRLRDRRMPTSARVPANSKDREHSCRLFLDVQTQMERTPPLLFWCGGAVSLVGFFAARGRGQLWDRKHRQISLGGSPARLSWIYRGKTQWALSRRSPHSPARVSQARWTILLFTLRIHSLFWNEDFIERC